MDVKVGDIVFNKGLNLLKKVTRVEGNCLWGCNYWITDDILDLRIYDEETMCFNDCCVVPANKKQKELFNRLWLGFLLREKL